MHIHLLQVVGDKNLRSNKDTNGGYGTVNDFGNGLVATFLKLFKKMSMNFPEITPAYITSILKQQGHLVTYGVNELDSNTDVVLIQTSIIHFKEELNWAKDVKDKNKNFRVGFYGGMCTGNPELYAGLGDFTITGEIENALLNGNIADFSGIINAGLIEDLNTLPFPEWSHIRNWGNRYGALKTTSGHSIPMLGSRGCPMSCAYYCTYPLVQGSSFRMRSPENLVDEVIYLQKNYGMTNVLFRDPIFSLKMKRIESFCSLILSKNLKFSWICETHPRFLTADLIQAMSRAGCVAIKLGIESANLEVMKQSHRSTSPLDDQEQVIKLCEKNGIDVLGFYILGYFHDNPQTIQQTINYAISLNTYGAQFTIATPYPGTDWFAELNKEDQKYKLDKQFNNYTQYQLVYNHPNLSHQQLEELKDLAYRAYYLRWGYLKKHIKRLIQKT